MLCTQRITQAWMLTECGEPWLTYVRPPSWSLGDPANLRLANRTSYPVTAILFLQNDLALRTWHGLPFFHHILQHSSGWHSQNSRRRQRQCLCESQKGWVSRCMNKSINFSSTTTNSEFWDKLTTLVDSVHTCKHTHAHTHTHTHTLTHTEKVLHWSEL